MGYKKLGRQLQNYEQEIPEWLQSFFADYSADPYQGAVMDEWERRSDDTLGRGLGQMSSYFGNAGRMGGGMMGQSMEDAILENTQRLRGDEAGLMSQDYQGHLQRMLEASGILGGIQQTGMGGLVQGYGDDQRLKGTRYTANKNLEGSKYQTDAYRDIGMGNLGMNRDQNAWNNNYQYEMMPYQQLNMLGSGVGGLMGPYNQNQSWGSSSGSPGGGGKTGNALQGGSGGAMMGWGMNNPRNGPGRNFNTLDYAPGGRYDR